MKKPKFHITFVPDASGNVFVVIEHPDIKPDEGGAQICGGFLSPHEAAILRDVLGKPANIFNNPDSGLEETWEEPYIIFEDPALREIILNLMTQEAYTRFGPFLGGGYGTPNDRLPFSNDPPLLGD